MSHLLFPLPDTPAALLRADLAEFLASPKGYPRVLVCNERTMEDVRKEAHDKQERRKYLTQPEPITAFSQLEQT